MTPIEVQQNGMERSPTRPSGPTLRGHDTVLIQVPHVCIRHRQISRAWPRSAEFWRRTDPTWRPRRRLKREVRLAGRILGGLLLAGAFLNCCAALGLDHIPGRSLGRGTRLEDPPPAAWTLPRPTVVLSIEAAAPSGDDLEDRPVVLPGYLLPDDSREEAEHEGS